MNKQEKIDELTDLLLAICGLPAKARNEVFDVIKKSYSAGFMAGYDHAMYMAGHRPEPEQA